jgi:hypothetical protein
MKEVQHQFLTVLGHPPARLTVEQTAWALGCQVHDIPILIAARLIKPLGNPAQNAIKFFSTSEILEQAKDRSWLAKATNTICQRWKKKNIGKNAGGEAGPNDDRLPLANISSVAQAQ